MKEIFVQGEKQSLILVGENFHNFRNYIPYEKLIVITDKNIEKYYGKYFKDDSTIVIGMGEKIKTFATIQFIIDKLIRFEADRSTFILGVGGGIVCDIVGFAASIYMRGLPFGFIATSLLSQVDASVGGKNGVNFDAYKNIAGTFNQPQFVLCDINMLRTLECNEMVNAFGEIVKHTLIADAKMFKYLESNTQTAMEIEGGVLERLIENSINIKARIVSRDDREKGERRKLNFGHTFAHAIEKHYNIQHGGAVAIGIFIAAKISFYKKFISKEDVKRIGSLLSSLGLPVDISLDKDKLLEAIGKDKKRDGNNIHLILLRKIGEAIVVEMTFDELKRILDDMY